MFSGSSGYDEYYNNKKVKWDWKMVKGCLFWVGILFAIIAIPLTLYIVIEVAK